MANEHCREACVAIYKLSGTLANHAVMFVHLSPARAIIAQAWFIIIFGVGTRTAVIFITDAPRRVAAATAIGEVIDGSMMVHLHRPSSCTCIHTTRSHHMHSATPWSAASSVC